MLTGLFCSFSGAVAKLRKATISFVMSPSVCPPGTTRLPLEGFSWSLIISGKTAEKIQVS
jgi:hypothetical protein